MSPRSSASALSPGRWPFARLAAGLLVLFALALLALNAAPAQAQDGITVKLVSNTGQTSATALQYFNSDHAQAFTTGSFAAGYTLTRVDFPVQDTNSVEPTYTVSIHSDSSGGPGASLGTLTNPVGGLPEAESIAQFTTDGITLAANTTYWVVFDISSVSNGLIGYIRGTSSDAEDAVGLPGWSIANSLNYRDNSATTWNINTTRSLKLAIHGTTRGVPAGRPVLQSVTLQADATTLTLAYDRRLDETSTPATSAFNINVTGGTNPTVSKVDVSRNEVTLTLSAAVTPSGALTAVAYTAPDSNPIRSARYPIGTAEGIAASTAFPHEGVNWAPIFTGTSGGRTNAPPITLVSLDLYRNRFSDPDGGALSYSFYNSDPSAAINETPNYNSTYDRLFHMSNRDVYFAGLTPPAGHPYLIKIRMVATDPDGATAETNDHTFSTGWSYWTSTRMLKVDGATLTVGVPGSPANISSSAVNPNTLDLNTTPSTNPFTVTVNGREVSSTVTWSSTAATLTLAEPATRHDTVTLSFTNPDDQLMWTDHNDNKGVAGNFEDWQVSHVKHTGPAFQGATANGTELKVAFEGDRDLDSAHVPDAAAFTVTADGSPVQVTGVSISGSVATLTLASAVSAEQAIRVAYDRHQAGANPLQDASGGLVRSFGSMPVNRATLSGEWFTMPFARPVKNYETETDDSGSFTGAPVEGGCTENFTVRVEGEVWPAGVTFGAESGGNVDLWRQVATDSMCDDNPHTHMFWTGEGEITSWEHQEIATGQHVTLTYDGPYLKPDGTFAAGLRYTDGDQEPVPAFTVDVLIDHGTASVNGNILKVEFGVQLDDTVVLDPADFEVSRGFDGTVAVLSASISGDTVTLVLAESVQNHEEVYLYFENRAETADLWDEPVQTDIRDINGNELIHIPIRQVGPLYVFPPTPVKVLTPNTPPEFERASVPANDRQVLWVAFNEDMDESTIAPGSAFTLTARSPDGETSTILGTGQAEFVAQALGKLRVHLASAPPEDATLTLSYSDSSNQITDAAGLALESFADKTVNNGVPRVVGVQIVSDPGDDLAYIPGDEIMVRLTFNDAIKVSTSNGTPRLRIDLYYTDLDRTDGRPWHGIGQPDTGERYAAYHGGSGTHTLDFSYTVLDSDRYWPRGVAVVADSLELDGAVLRSSWRSDRVGLSHPGLDHDPAHLVKREVDPPAPSAAMVVSSETIAINFNEALDERSAPAPSAFEVTVNGARSAVSDVTVRGGSVTLTLDVLLYHDDTVDRVAYTPPETNPLRDLRHNPAAAFSFDTVTNTTQAMQWGALLAVAQMPFDGGRGCHPLDWLRELPQDRQARCDSEPSSTANRNTTYPGSRLSVDDFTYRGVEYRVTEVIDSHPDPDSGWHGGSFHIKLDEAWPEGLRTATMCIGDNAVALADRTALLLADAEFPETQSGRVAYWPTGSSALSAIAKTFKDAADSATVRVAINLYESSDDAGCLDDSGAGGAGGQGQQPPTSPSTAAPTTVTAVAVTSDAGADDTYALGDVISIAVTFSGAVKVTGSPQITIDMDPADWGSKQATYASGSETATLTFTHTVVEPNFSSQGIAVLEDTLSLNGGTIRSMSSGKNADLSHDGLAHDSEHKVNWEATSDTSGGGGGGGGAGGQQGSTTPTVSAVAVTSDAGSDDTYGLGDVIRITVTFSEAVDVTGSPQLTIDMDPADWGSKQAAYSEGSGTATLTFTHTVVEPNYSPQGIAVLANTLSLNGGGIESTAADADADLSHSGLAHDADHKVDWQQSGG